MFLLDAAAVLIGLAALLGLFNHHVLKLPFAIGLMVSGLLASIGVLAVDHIWPSMGLAGQVRGAVLQVDFSVALLSGMLSLLLFAGALHTNMALLRERAVPILLMATLGVAISTGLAATLAYGLFSLLGFEIDFAWCLVFGALISPTDPIAVIGILKSAGAPKELEIKIVGESLFNDGVGVVLFTVLLAFAVGAEDMGASEVAILLAEEVVGGVVMGLVFGWLCSRALASLEEPNLEILLTLATVLMIGFLAHRLHVSGPLAAVVAGLFVGNHGRSTAMGESTERTLDTVWTFLDETLNAVLFLLIGVELFALSFVEGSALLAALMIPSVLLARWVGVALPLSLVRRHVDLGPGAVQLLTWGGLKGGISIALAMKMPDFEGRDVVLTVTYAIVVFSILVQGLTIGPYVRRIHGDIEAAPKVHA